MPLNCNKCGKTHVSTYNCIPVKKPKTCKRCLKSYIRRHKCEVVEIEFEAVFNFVGNGNQVANAAFIVHCVNSHDKLVEALKEIIELVEDEVDITDVGDIGRQIPNTAMKVYDQAKQALKEVE